MSEITRKLDKMRPVASKNGEYFYTEIQGMSEKFIFANKEVRDALKVPFSNAEDAVKHGRKVIEELKSKSIMFKIIMLEIAEMVDEVLINSKWD